MHTPDAPYFLHICNSHGWHFKYLIHIKQSGWLWDTPQGNSSDTSEY